jgi:hypothetical protein
LHFTTTEQILRDFNLQLVLVVLVEFDRGSRDNPTSSGSSARWLRGSSPKRIGVASGGGRFLRAGRKCGFASGTLTIWWVRGAHE